MSDSKFPFSFIASMHPVSRILILVGCIFIFVGLLWSIAGKYLHLGRLPGDIVVERENFKFYFPLMTSLLLSAILSLIGYLIRHFSGK